MFTPAELTGKFDRPEPSTAEYVAQFAKLGCTLDAGLLRNMPLIGSLSFSNRVNLIDILYIMAGRKPIVGSSVAPPFWRDRFGYTF